MFTLRRLKVKTLRIKLDRAILYNFNCKIYIRDFAQHLSPPFFSFAEVMQCTEYSKI